MVVKSSLGIIPFIVMLVFFAAFAQTVAVTGKVQDSQGAGIEGAQVRLVARNIGTVTDKTGAFVLQDNTPAAAVLQERTATFAPRLKGSEIMFGIAADQEDVSVEVYNAMGRMVLKAFSQSLQRGSYAINPLPRTAPVQVYFVKMKTGSHAGIFRMPFVNTQAHRAAGVRKLNDDGSAHLAKTTATLDTIAASKAGYVSKRLPIDSYTGSYIITLEKAPFDITYPQEGSRVFTSPGGTIMFQWNALAGATSYDVVVDGATVATGVPGGVPFASVPVTKFTAVNGAHSWKVVATTTGGQQTSSTFNFTVSTAVDGTTGTPFGGIGAGAVKFCPWKGDFAFQAKVPPGKAGYQAQTNMKFQLFTKRGTIVVTQDKLIANKLNNRYDDDAAYPVMYANFGTTNDVTVTMTAVSPFNRDDMQKSTYPLACYQFTLWNSQATSVDAAVAFETNTPQKPAVIDGKGFATSAVDIQRAIFAKSSDPSATVTVGNDAGFLTSGALNNQTTDADNKVAVKVALDPGEKKDVKFVFAWYNAGDKSAYYYTNFVNNAQEVAQYALDNFDTYRDKAVAHVERFRASNVPDWMLNQTMNQIVWVNNVQYMRDGRYGVTEGIYGWMGQMDQGWHAFGAGIWQVPEVIWSWKGGSEMEFWARTMMVGGNNDGQISHDFTGSDHGYCQWDDPGYHGWGGPDWPDQNCGFIFGLYEGFIATGDKARMDYYWPYMKRTGNRLYYMASSQYQDAQYPFTFTQTGCTYDKGSQDHPLYNSGLACTAFKILEVMAGIYNETALRDKYHEAYTKAVDSFQKRWLNNVSFNANQETTFAGLWMSLHFGLGQQFTDEAIDKAFNHMLTNYWKPLDLGMDASSRDGEGSGWVPYVIGHLGGALLLTDRAAEWRAIERDLHNRIITNRNRVYNSTIYLCYQARTENYAASDFGGGDFYCSMPVLWHNYMGFTGFLYNAYTGEMWLQPRLPSAADKWGESMNHELKDAFLCIPGTYGSLNYKETGATFQTKDVTVKFDKPVKVTCIYLKDNYGGTVSVSVDGASQQVQRVGTGKYDRMVKVQWAGSVGPGGIHIVANP